MAVIETTQKMTAALALDDGTTAQGNIRTVSTSLGTLDPSAWDMQKAWNIMSALDNGLLTKSLVWGTHVTTSYIAEE